MNKGIVITLIVTALIIGLLVTWGNKTQNRDMVYFKDTNVACLTHGHQRIAEHIHPTIQINVDGKSEQIPANIGISENCMSEIHTHDDTGVIHAESSLPGRIKDFHMGDFFKVWGQSQLRAGYDLEIIQDGEIKNSIEDVKFIDHSDIKLNYTSNGSAKETATNISESATIDLSGQGLSQIPPSIFQKINTEKLDISTNSLTGAIQAEIRQLSNLKILNASNNNMTGVPAEIGQLKMLEVLDLSNNQLTGLPHELSNLENLKILNLSGNPYSTYDLDIIKEGLSHNTQIIVN